MYTWQLDGLRKSSQQVCDQWFVYAFKLGHGNLLIRLQSVVDKSPNTLPVSTVSKPLASINSAAQRASDFENISKRTSSSIAQPIVSLQASKDAGISSVSRGCEGSNFEGLAGMDDALMYFRIGNSSNWVTANSCLLKHIFSFYGSSFYISDELAPWWAS